MPILSADKTISDEIFASIYKVPEATLRGIRAKGGDPWDARSIVSLLRKTTRKPDTWVDFFKEDEDSPEYWKKEKEKETVRGLRLKNSLAEGEQFKREDVDAATMQLGSAFKLALMEARAQLPPQLAGLDEAGVDRILDAEIRKILTNLSDLGSALWNQIREKYARGEDNSQPGDGSDAAQPGPNSQRLVSRKRAAGSGSHPPA